MVSVRIVPVLKSNASKKKIRKKSGAEAPDEFENQFVSPKDLVPDLIA